MTGKTSVLLGEDGTASRGRPATEIQDYRPDPEWCSEDEVYGMLAGAGIGTPRRVHLPGPPGDELPAGALALLAHSPAGVVLKIDAPGLLHKSEAGGSPSSRQTRRPS